MVRLGGHLVTSVQNNGRLLLRLPSWLGDFVSTEPVIRALHASMGEHPELMSLAAPAPLLALFEDRFEGALRIPITKNSEGKGWRGHDTALLFNGAFRSAWAAWRARIPTRIGSSKGGRGPFLTDVIGPARERGRTPLGLGLHGSWPRALPRPFSGVCIEFASRIGLEVRRARPLLIPSEAARWRVRRRLARAGLTLSSPYIVINVGSRNDSSKAWTIAGWIEVAEKLALRSGLPIFLACGPGEERCVQAVMDGVASERIHALLDPIAELPELVAVCAGAHAILCTDGGVRHVARATGAPSLVLFGPTDPRHSANHNGRERHLRVEVPCGPCHDESCALSTNLRRQCMHKISVDEVLEIALERIEEGARVRALR
ncbi:MAG: heptosyltransferase-2 [Planctomycetota bacterium]|jgi:heptosyltransferase-2